MLVDAILADIDDASPIGGPPSILPTSLRDLLDNYNKFSQAHAKYQPVGSQTTGAELKKAIRLLEPESQVELLYAYCTGAGVEIDTDSSPLVESLGGVRVGKTNADKLAESKKIRVLLKRIFGALIAILISMFVGVTIAMAVLTGALKDFLSTQLVVSSTEILKFIFSPTKPPQ